MTSKGIIRCSISFICKNPAFYDASINIFKPTAVCYNQSRGKRYKRPDKDLPHPWHVPVKSKELQHQLTPANRAFLDDLAVDEHKSSSGSPLKNEPWPRSQWTHDTIRTGILGIKIGTIPQWRKDGTKFYCQLIQILDNHVVRYTPPGAFQEQAGFYPLWRKDIGSVVVGAMSCQPHSFTKRYHNLFSEAGVPPKRHLSRFWVTADAAVQPGTPLSVNHFKVGHYVDASAKTINHGFQGVVKRFGFAGGRASHGTTKSHRRPGSLSSGLQRGIHKGKKMPGIMGGVWRITRGLKIWRINTKYNVLYITGGGVPGPNHCLVRLYDTRYKKQEAPMPTYFSEDGEQLLEDIHDEDLFKFEDDSIQFAEDAET